MQQFDTLLSETSGIAAVTDETDSHLGAFRLVGIIRWLPNLMFSLVVELLLPKPFIMWSNNGSGIRKLLHNIIFALCDASCFFLVFFLK